MIDRFWAKVDKTGDCWLWTGGRFENGYGAFKLDGKTVRAHRLSWEWANKEALGLRLVDHRTTCPKHCVNPDHLRPATTKQNGENRAGTPINNTSGYRGVSWFKGAWCASVKHQGRTIHLGRFADVHEAGEAARLKRLELFTHNDMDRR